MTQPSPESSPLADARKKFLAARAAVENAGNKETAYADYLGKMGTEERRLLAESYRLGLITPRTKSSIFKPSRKENAASARAAACAYRLEVALAERKRHSALETEQWTDFLVDIATLKNKGLDDKSADPNQQVTFDDCVLVVDDFFNSQKVAINQHYLDAFTDMQKPRGELAAALLGAGPALGGDEAEHYFTLAERPYYAGEEVDLELLERAASLEGDLAVSRQVPADDRRPLQVLEQMFG